MKRNFLSVTMIILFCGFLLFFYALNHKKTGNNGFNRKFKDLGLSSGQVLQLPSSRCRIAGISSSHIYLHNLAYPDFGLFSAGYSLSEWNEINLELPAGFSDKHKRIEMGVIDDTTAYVLSNQHADLMLINLKSGKHKDFKSPGIYFDRNAYVAEGLMIGRYVGLSKDDLQIDLVRLNYEKNRIDRTYALKREPEELFSNDGRFERDPIGSRFFYTYYYRGEFLCLDSNLSLLFSAKTIDTTTAHISIKRETGKGPGKKGISLTQSKPPKVVNKYSCVYQGRFYLNSNKIADNESPQAFEHNHVIDVYGTDTGEYLYSFYIPKFNGEKMHGFSVREDCLFVINKQTMVKYRLARRPD